MAAEDDAGHGRTAEQAVADFHETLEHLRSSASFHPASMIREKREELRQRRMQLEAEIDELCDSEDGDEESEDQDEGAPESEERAKQEQDG